MAVTKIHNDVVVVFDICSSSKIFNSLSELSQQNRYLHLLRDLKRYLAEKVQPVLKFENYKFIGDGWILLFPESVNGQELLDCLRNLCLVFRDLYDTNIAHALPIPPPTIGLTFGIDKGPLVEVNLWGEKEYIGRAITLACRLQGAKEPTEDPAYKALISTFAFGENFKAIMGYSPVKTTRVLHNMHEGAPVPCMKVAILSGTSQPAAQGMTS